MKSYHIEKMELLVKGSETSIDTDEVDIIIMLS